MGTFNGWIMRCLLATNPISTHSAALPLSAIFSAIFRAIFAAILAFWVNTARAQGDLEPNAQQALKVSDDLRIQSLNVRKNAFSIGLGGARHSLKAGDGNEFIGNSAAVQLGAAYISESWFFNASVDILLGPHEPTRNKQLNADFFGTGITLLTGFSAQGLDLRSPEGGYGFALGLNYADTVGRSIGRNRREGSANTAQSSPLIDNYVMRVNNLSLLPGIFFSWLKPARPRGNTPELLMTRLEGYMVMIGTAMPLINSYQARYETRERPDPTQAGLTLPPQTVSEKGRLRGYSIILSLTAILGV